MDRMEVDYVETRHGDGGGGDRPVTIQEQDAYSPAGPSLSHIIGLPHVTCTYGPDRTLGMLHDVST
jgi:hypothetical protein